MGEYHGVDHVHGACCMVHVDVPHVFHSQGVVLNKAFHRFRVEQAPDEESGKRLLVNAGVSHYWDLAKNYVPAS